MEHQVLLYFQWHDEMTITMAMDYLQISGRLLKSPRTHTAEHHCHATKRLTPYLNLLIIRRVRQSGKMACKKIMYNKRFHPEQKRLRAVDFEENNIEKVARCMKALAHPLRLKVLVALNDQELSVQDLVDAVGTTQSNVSQHLTIMRDKNILSSRREANQVFYRVGDCKVLELVALTKSIFCTP